MNRGKVYLVGAGPGDPELITRKALRLIQSADVILYDRLIPLELLDETSAECIDVGKAPTKHRFSQSAINQLLVERALGGQQVVRLKGGDPLIFGRGGEEALACYAAGIPFEIVPGVSSALAVPTYAGIPLTHREVNRAFTVITGHEDPALINPQWFEGLVKVGGTLVILMGVKQLAAILENLIRAGLDPQTPAAIIENGTLPQQVVLQATAETLADLAQARPINPPAITVIGEVVNLRDQGLAWFAPDLIKVPPETSVSGL